MEIDIQKEKQARWAVERPLFEAEFIHSHLLPFFNFNENTGDYEIKSEFSEDEDKELPFEVLNTGWVMWLRAKRDAKTQAVPECTWTQNEDGYFDASCGQSFVFSEPDDTPSSHEFTHCCFCGGQLIEPQEST